LPLAAGGTVASLPAAPPNPSLTDAPAAPAFLGALRRELFGLGWGSPGTTLLTSIGGGNVIYTETA